MAKSILEVVLQGVDKLSGPMRKAGESVKDFEKRTKASSDSMKKLGATALKVTGSLAALGFAAKKAFDLAAAGAAIKQTGDSFGFLLQKVGANAHLLDELRAASKGTISDMDLMSSTATLLAGAQGDLASQLATSTPRLLEIAKAAQKLNPALGDTTFLYNSLATGVKRASPMLLDNLGLTIRIGAASEAYAQALGKTVEQLTADEQKQALLNETLRAGAVLIEQAGGTTDSATDSYTQLGATVSNLTDIYKVQIHEALNPIVTLLGKNAQAALEQVRGMEVLNAALGAGVISQREYSIEAMKVYEGAILSATAITEYKTQIDEKTRAEKIATSLTKFHEDAQVSNRAAMRRAGEMASRLAAGMRELSAETTAATLSAKTISSTLDNDVAVATGRTTRAIIEAEQEMAAIKQQMLETGTISGELRQRYSDLAQEVVRLTAVHKLAKLTWSELIAINKEMAVGADRVKHILAGLIDVEVEHVDQLDKNADATDKWRSYNDDLAVQLGHTTREVIEAEAELARMKAEVDDGTVAVGDNDAAMQALEISIFHMKQELRDSTGVIDDNTAALAENADGTERNQELKDQYALASGRATVATILLEGQIRAATEAFVAEGVASGYTAQQIANMRVQLDAATGALRGGASAANAGASALDNYTVSARAAWEAAQRLGSRGPGQVGGPPPGEYEGEGGAERFAEEQGWQVSAAGRDQEEHAKQVLGQIVAEQSGVWESGGDMSGWVKEFMMSSAGTGLAAGFDESVVNAAIQDLEIQKANAAQGLSGIVPGGYPRDSFLIGATSGEHVQITPQNMMRGAGMGGAMVINTVNVFGVQTDSQLFDAVTRVARQRGRAFARVM